MPTIRVPKPDMVGSEPLSRKGIQQSLEVHGSRAMGRTLACPGTRDLSGSNAGDSRQQPAGHVCPDTTFLIQVLLEYGIPACSHVVCGCVPTTTSSRVVVTEAVWPTKAVCTLSFTGKAC